MLRKDLKDHKKKHQRSKDEGHLYSIRGKIKDNFRAVIKDRRWKPWSEHNQVSEPGTWWALSLLSDSDYVSIGLGPFDSQA